MKGRLTEKQIIELADEISVTEMTKIAIKYLNLKKGLMGNIKVNNPWRCRGSKPRDAEEMGQHEPRKSSQGWSFQFFRFKPFNEFSKFRKFPFRQLCHPCELTTYGKLFFTLVLKMTHV